MYPCLDWFLEKRLHFLVEDRKCEFTKIHCHPLTQCHPFSGLFLHSHLYDTNRTRPISGPASKRKGCVPFTPFSLAAFPSIPDNLNTKQQNVSNTDLPVLSVRDCDRASTVHPSELVVSQASRDIADIAYTESRSNYKGGRSRAIMPVVGIHTITCVELVVKPDPNRSHPLASICSKTGWFAGASP